MAFQAPQVPFKLTAEDMGQGDFGKSFGQGATAIDTIIGSYLKHKQGQEISEKLPFIAPQAAADVKKTELANEFYPGLTGSQIGLNNSTSGLNTATAGLTNKKTQWYDQQAQPAIDLEKAQAAKAQQDALMSQYLLQAYKQSSSNDGQSAPSQSYYGLDVPKPTTNDFVAHKMGTDTFTPKQQNFYQMKKIQDDAFQKENDDIIARLNDANQFRVELGKYNELMDQSTLSGSIGGSTAVNWLGGGLTDTSQKIDNTVNNMGKTGVAQMRDAMGNAKFSNLDMKLSQNLKPDRSWNVETRKLYTDFNEAVYQRMNEQQQFYSTIRNNPALGFNKANADAAWLSHQNNDPISDGDQLIPENIGHDKWKQYLTPESLESIKKTGRYDPTKQTEDKKRHDAETRNNSKGTGSTPKAPWPSTIKSDKDLQEWLDNQSVEGQSVAYKYIKSLEANK